MFPLLRLPALVSALVVSLAACGKDLPQVSSATGSGGASSATGSGGSSSSTAGAGGGQGGGAPEVAACNRGPASQLCNPFGLSLDRAAMNGDTYWSLVGDVFQVNFYRPEPLFLDQFEKDPAICADCDAAVARGLYLVLVVRNNGSPTTPTTPPPDLDLYRTALGSVLDHYQGSIAAVVIESEADLPASYGGSAEQYLAQLRMGCEIAHVKGVACSDSGVSSTSVLLWLAQYYAGIGNPEEAIRIFQAAKNNPEVPEVFKGGQASTADVEAFFAANAGRLARAEELLGGHRAAGVDYNNFHWYEQDETTFAEVMAILRTRTGCYRIMTDAIGQRGDLPTQEVFFKLILSKELGLQYAVWASRDTESSRSLVYPLGALRPSGETFAQLSTSIGCGE